MMLFKRLQRGWRTLPYGMFDSQSYGLAAKNAHVLERIYHKGQAFTWDGKEVLESLVQTHGKPSLSPSQRTAISRIFGLILWGELAAWRISAELADEIEPLEAKMAATSQAFDEARHFYVMHDYLSLVDALPERLDRQVENLLEEVMNANSLAKKLMGMQLMVEPVALTLFQVVRELGFEPVLTHLLPYYERDEARHVALGLKYLPALVEKMSVVERLDLWRYQFKLLSLEVLALKTIQDDLAGLGLNPRNLVEIGRAKQMAAFDIVFGGLEGKKRSMLGEALGRYMDFFMELTLPEEEGEHGLRDRFSRAISAMLAPSVEFDPNALEPDINDEQVPLITAFKNAVTGARKRAQKRKSS
jgi:hypothetical protein